MALSVNVVLWSRNVAIDNCSVIKQFEISHIVSFLVVFGSVHFPRGADFGSTLLGLLVRSAVGEVEAGQSARRWL